MNEVKGSCHCGNIKLKVSLTQAPLNYNPRACDCDFCTKHGASYISDSQGSVAVEIKDQNFKKIYHQGSETADFLLCSNCGVFVGVSYLEGEKRYMAINSKAINETVFGQEVSASPKKLSKVEKINRWKEVWFSQVTFVE